MSSLQVARLLVCALLVASGAAAAAEPPTAGATLPQLIDAALRAHPDLQAAGAAVDVAKARLAQAGLRPAPVLDVSNTSDFLFGNDGEYSRSVGISQAFPVAGRLLREKNVARVDIAIAQTEVDDARRKLAGEVMADVYKLLVLDRQIAAQDQRTSADNALAKVVEARFKAAEVSELDVNQVQIDLQAIAQKRSRLEGDRQAAQIALNGLLARPGDAPFAIAERLPAPATLPPLEQLQDQALSHRADLRGAALAVDRADAERALAHASRWDDWTVRFEVSQDRLVLDGGPSQHPNRSLGVSLSVPLPLTRRTEGAIAEAGATGAQAAAKVASLRLAIATEIATARAEATRAQDLLLQDQQTIRPLAERNLRLAEQGYRQGLVPLSDVTQARRQLADICNTDLDSLSDYAQALARLHTAVGDLPLPPASIPDPLPRNLP